MSGTDELFNAAKSELRTEGFQIDSASESEETGMTGLEIVISIAISFGASVVANSVQPKIQSALTRLGERFGKRFTGQVVTNDNSEERK